MTDSIIIPDAFPEDQQQFMEKPPTDPWEEMSQWVLDNIPGVDVEKFAAEMEAIRAKHHAELQPIADAIIEELKVTEDSKLDVSDWSKFAGGSKFQPSQWEPPTDSQSEN